MKPADEERFAALVEWNKVQGGFLNPAVEVYDDPATGFSLRVKTSSSDAADCASRPAPPGHHHRPPAVLGAGDAVVACPLSTTLSYLNALIGGPLRHPPPEQHGESHALDASGPAPAFPAAFMASVPPHVIGRFFLMQQYLLGSASHWHPYIATLPQPEHVASWALPAFWPDDDAAFLAGTNAGTAAAEMAANAAAELRQARRALRDAGFVAWKDYTTLLYRWTFCVFTSRSFRPSLVVPAALWGGLAPSAGCGLDDFSVLMPLFDLGNHDPLGKATWDSESEPGRCRLVVSGDSRYRPGEQVFNNYGLKTNSELLVGYGFVIPATETVHNDYVHLRLRAAAPGPAQASAGSTQPHRGDEGEDAKGVEQVPKPPRDFLISLRPVSQHSSIVGRARQFFQIQGGSGNQGESASAFAHIDGNLLYELCASHLPAPNASSSPDMAARLANVFADPTPPEFEDLVSGLREMLLGKLAADYERLLEEEPEEVAALKASLAEASVAEEASVAASLTANQALAFAHRLQCEQVLKNAMVSLDPTIRFEVVEEEGEEVG